MAMSEMQVTRLREDFLRAYDTLVGRSHPVFSERHREDLRATLVALAIAAGDVRSTDVIYAEADAEIGSRGRGRRVTTSNVVPFPTHRMTEVAQVPEDEFEMQLTLTYRNRRGGLTIADQANVDESFFAEDAASLIEIVREAHDNDEIDIRVLPVGTQGQQ